MTTTYITFETLDQACEHFADARNDESITMFDLYRTAERFGVPMAYLVGEPHALDELLTAAWATLGRAFVLGQVPWPLIKTLRQSIGDVETALRDEAPSGDAVVLLLDSTAKVRAALTAS